MKTLGQSWRQTCLIGRHTLREAWRQRVVGGLIALALALALGARWLRQFNFGAAELDFLADCGFGAMAFFGAVLSIAGTARLFLRELENRSVLALLAKPVGRTEFVLGKFLGIAALLAGFCAILGLGLGFTLFWRSAGLAGEFGAEAGISLRALAAGTFLQWLKLTLLAAFVLLVASYARSQLFTIAAGVFLLVIFHLQPIARDAWTRGDSWLGQSLAMALPNFQLFALERGVTGFSAEMGPGLVRLAAYGFGYVALACSLAAFSFHRREL